MVLVHISHNSYNSKLVLNSNNLMIFGSENRGRSMDLKQF